MQYRGAIKRGTLRPGAYFEHPPRAGLPTLVFIHGSVGAPSHLADFATPLRARANCAAFVWDSKARLAPSAEILRAALLDLPRPVVVVAHSMGALLPAYLGATDQHRSLEDLAAIYLNPLIGGSRYAGDFRALAWLGVGATLQRLFFRPSFTDLAPESDFQRTICMGSRSSFAQRTMIVFTERQGREPDVPAARLLYYFGRTRDEIVSSLGSTVAVPSAVASGHRAPLRTPQVVIPLLERLLGIGAA